MPDYLLFVGTFSTLVLVAEVVWLVVLWSRKPKRLITAVPKREERR
jgi:hypothetical protein